MKKVRITVVRKACYPDLMEKYENPIEHACDIAEGAVFIANGLAETGWIVRECMGVHVPVRHGAGTRRGELLRWLDEESHECNDKLQ